MPSILAKKSSYQPLLSVIVGFAGFVLCQSSHAQFVKESQAAQHSLIKEGVADVPCQKPRYPHAALLKKAEGTVTLSYLIGEDGKVLDAKVRKSSGNIDLDNTALVALSRCKYSPAIIDGKVTEAWSTVQYVWSLEEADLRY